MLKDAHATVAEIQSEISALVRVLHDTQERLRDLTDGEVDAVVHSSGQSYLLHEAQDQLRESEARTRLLVEASNIGLWDWNVVTNDVFFSPEWKNQLGYTDSEMPNRFEEWESRLHPEDREATFAAVKDYFESRAPEYKAEFRLRHKDGTWRWILPRATLTRNAAGQPVRMMGCHIDLTARKKSEEQFAEQAALIDETRDAIMVRDLTQHITFWSKGAERLYGFAAHEVKGRSAPELLHVDAVEFARADNAVRTAGIWNGEIQKRTEAGVLRTLDSRWTLVRDSQGHPRSILTIDTDITERKKLEQQVLRAQRMDSIGTLAGGIAHDLNNVFAPIIMSLDLLRMTFNDSASVELIEMIASSAQHGADMVKQVLSFARGVEGERAPLELKLLVAEIQRIANDTFLKDIQVRTVVPDDLWPVFGDRTQIHQVLLNLCVNARDAMPDGGLLSISAENVLLDEHYAGLHIDAKPGPHVVLHVEDNGQGMPASVMEKIFEPFFTTKEIGSGTGLGLSTSLAILKSHGGFIHVYSEIGKGTNFKVFLPALPDSPSQIPAAALTTMPRGRGELILVIDDEKVVREITQRTLEAFGYRAVLAENGAEGIAIYATRKAEISVVLTDMTMPVMDGPSTIRVLRSLNPRVLVIGTSGRTGEVSSLVANHFLSKPYTARKLLTVLQQILEEAQ